MAGAVEAAEGDGGKIVGDCEYELRSELRERYSKIAGPKGVSCGWVVVKMGDRD